MTTQVEILDGVALRLGYEQESRNVPTLAYRVRFDAFGTSENAGVA